MALETELAKVSLDRVARRDPEKLYHKMTVRELDALGSGFAWDRYFKAAGAPGFQVAECGCAGLHQGHECRHRLRHRSTI